MARITAMNRSRADKTRDKTRRTYERAKDGMQSTYTQVQSNVKSGLQRPQALLAIIVGIVGALLEQYTQRGRKRRRENEKGVHRLRRTFSEGIESAQDTFSSGMTTAQKSFAKNARKARKNLRQAQHNLHNMQSNLQENISSGIATGMAKTQDIMHMGADGVRRVTSYPHEMQRVRQERHEQREQRRARARTLFRWGIVTGVILALIYAPVSGAETRRYLAEKWQQGRDSFNKAQ